MRNFNLKQNMLMPVISGGLVVAKDAFAMAFVYQDPPISST
jgi:hypothetical protein